MSLLFYTAADSSYEHLIPTYIYFALKNNTSSYAEVGVENANKYKKKNEKTIEVLRDLFGKRFRLTTVNFNNVLSPAVRWVTTPTLVDRCDHVYIGDIDVLIFDSNVEEQHIRNMTENDAPFSNVIRKKSIEGDRKYRLSGLHFAPTDVQYPLPDLSDIPYHTYGKEADKLDRVGGSGDEHVLYKIMKKKGYMVPSNINFRPIHGIHMRTGSYPFGSTRDHSAPNSSFDKISTNEQKKAWSGIELERYRNQFEEELHNQEFQKLYATLNVKVKNTLMILENVCKGSFEELETQAYNCIISESDWQRLVRKGIQTARHDGKISTLRKIFQFLNRNINL